MNEPFPMSDGLVPALQFLANNHKPEQMSAPHDNDYDDDYSLEESHYSLCVIAPLNS